MNQCQFELVDEVTLNKMSVEYGRFPNHCYKKRAGFMIYVVDFGKSATQGKNVHVLQFLSCIDLMVRYNYLN